MKEVAESLFMVWCALFAVVVMMAYVGWQNLSSLNKHIYHLENKLEQMHKLLIELKGR